MVNVRRRGRDDGGRLRARPGQPTGTITAGLHRLDLGNEGDALLSVPAGYRPDHPAPFILSLHGAGGNAMSGLYPLGELVDDAGLILLAPGSRGRTWDVILHGFGPDIAVINRALRIVFERCAVDPRRMGIAGFSDGASYALSLGITNGDHFPQVLAFSPGFMDPGEPMGTPRFFIAHGTEDQVLRIERTSRRIVPTLRQIGYDVRYEEFDGGHTVPPRIAREGLAWFLAGPADERGGATEPGSGTKAG